MALKDRIYLLFLLLVFLKFGAKKCLGLSMVDDGFPKKYKMDNYNGCKNLKWSYCVFDFKILPQDSGSKIWKTIVDSQKDHLKFDKAVFSRMICVPSYIDSKDDLTNYGKNVTKKELTGQVTLNVLDVQCEEKWKYNAITTIFRIFFVIYVIVVISSSWYDFKTKYKNDPNLRESKNYKLYTAFSVLKNWQKLTEKNTSSDFERLKNIQGIRFFNTMCVIAWHTIVSVGLTFVDDINELEKNHSSSITFYFMFMGVFLVQIFFVISPLLLTNQILEIHRKHGHFSFHHCAVIMVNRMFRFLPTLVVMVLLTFSNLLEGPHLIKLLNMTCRACADSWWATILQTNYMVPFRQMCMSGTWYLSVDTLMYFATLFLLYFKIKYNLNIKKVVGYPFAFLTLTFGMYIYINDFDVMFKPYPEALKNMFASPDMDELYVWPITSMSSGCIGILLGYIYFENKNRKDIQIGRIFNILWWLIFICGPIITLYASTIPFQGLERAILGPLIKPMFVLPLGMGVLGMAFNLGGIVKKFLESNFLVVMSNTTYCTYVFHFFVVFTKGVYNLDLVHFRSHYLLWWILWDLVVSFTLGTIFTIVFEYPGITLQKLFVPQIRKPENIDINENKEK